MIKPSKCTPGVTSFQYEQEKVKETTKIIHNRWDGITEVWTARIYVAVRTITPLKRSE